MPEDPNEQSVRRIAMWSGPRNLSTAMMRSWENRPDTSVIDEPLYPYHLASTGMDHPLREATIAAGPTNLSDAIERCLAKHLHSMAGEALDIYRELHEARLVLTR